MMSANNADTDSRLTFGTWPTPLEPAPHLATALGLEPDDLWFKRDDLSGLGGGGNKIRKLEWTIGAALAAGADTIVTTGAPQSNHARLTAAAGARLGIDVVLVFPGPQVRSQSGNLVLDSLFGARIAWAEESTHHDLASTAEAVADGLRSRGARPEVIPFGGSSTLGARGYMACGAELLQVLPGLATVVVALGSGGTMAGLVASLGPERVLGIDTGAMADPGAAVARFASEAGTTPVSPSQLRIRDDIVGSGYSDLTKPVEDALSLTARTEGVVLDPIYSGRAMAGLIAAVNDGGIRRGEKTVFLHTGGLPGLFGHERTVEWALEGLQSTTP